MRSTAPRPHALLGAALLTACAASSGPRGARAPTPVSSALPRLDGPAARALAQRATAPNAEELEALGHRDRSPAEARFVALAQGEESRVARATDADLFVVLLSGAARLSLAEGGEEVQLSPWSAALAQEGGAVLRASAPDTVAVTILVHGAQRYAEQSEPPPRACAGPGAQARDTSGCLRVRSFEAASVLSWRGGSMHARLLFEGADSPRAGLEVLTAAPDAPVPEHLHPGAWELLLPLEAQGTFLVPAQPRPGGAGANLAEQRRELHPGRAVFVPPDVRHAWVPGGTVPLVALQLYSPPGAEQRFRALAR